VKSGVSLYSGEVRRLALAAAIVSLGALVSATGAQACSCLKRTAHEALRDADAAIVARLVGVRPAGSNSADYRYRVRRVYKGRGIQGGGTVSVRSGVDGASCGLPEDRNRWFGLFLYRSGGRWTGGLCGLVAPRALSAAAAGTGSESALGGAHSCAS
jgi:hypothetical protein